MSMPSVLICDDSATMRLVLRRMLQGHGFSVAAEAANGQEAVDLARRVKPDLITMDVMLPGVDGFEATKAILRDGPARIVIVSAAGEALQADLGFRALQSGALDLVDKPEAADPGTLADWGEDLGVNLLALTRLPLGFRLVGEARRSRPSLPPRRVAALGIAASTGGPPALASLLKDVPPSLPFPVLVAQHIAPGFTDGLVRWLGTQTGLKVRMAAGGEVPEAGTVWIPRDRHDLLWASGRLQVLPNKGGVCHTGDRLRKAGGLTFAQDSASCVVDGMPAMAVARGGTDQRLTLEELGFCVMELGRHADGGLL